MTAAFGSSVFSETGVTTTTGSETSFPEAGRANTAGSESSFSFFFPIPKTPFSSEARGKKQIFEISWESCIQIPKKILFYMKPVLVWVVIKDCFFLV